MTPDQLTDEINRSAAYHGADLIVMHRALYDALMHKPERMVRVSSEHEPRYYTLMSAGRVVRWCGITKRGRIMMHCAKCGYRALRDDVPGEHGRCGGEYVV